MAIVQDERFLSLHETGRLKFGIRSKHLSSTLMARLRASSGATSLSLEGSSSLSGEWPPESVPAATVERA